MGFFDKLFGGAKPKVESDSVWQSADARLAGLAARVERHAAERQVLLLAHFPNTLEALMETVGSRRSVERARSETDLLDALTSPSASDTHCARKTFM